MANVILLALLLWHIISVIAWYGSLFAFVFGISPSIRSMTIDNQQSFLRSFMPKYSRAVSASAVSTMLAGLLLFSYISTVNTSYMPSVWSWTLITLGAILGLVSGFVTLGGLLPIASKLQRSLPVDRTASPEKSDSMSGPRTITSLQRENPVSVISRVIFVMLTMAIILMIVGATL
jgi:hypothetical protein